MTKFLPKHGFSFITNPDAVVAQNYGHEQEAILNAQGLQAAREEISSWPGYQPTPLISLPGLARAANVSSLVYKDEGPRFGLGSFKPLGGAYAVLRTIADQVHRTTGEHITASELREGHHRDIVDSVTMCAATDGNHGRSVAWGSQMFGCRCVIYINEAVTVSREKAIAAYGAEVRRIPGSFDDAVRAASHTSDSQGWHVVSDTAAGGNIAASRNVMQGYAVLADEAISQLPANTPPSHLFVQAGVGGLAGAVVGQLWQAFGPERPIAVIVEPHSAGCWFESFKAGKPVAVSGDLESLMAGLACGELSPLSWPILKPGAFAAMTIADTAAIDTMRLLAEGCGTDQRVVGGESGVAGLAGFLLASQDEETRSVLGLNDDSRVLVIGSEGDTDPETYQEIVGRTGNEVRTSNVEEKLT
jgi:diaminopropionate ammonia-lyase